MAGYCASVRIAEIESQGYVLTPGRYVGSEIKTEDGETAGSKILRLTKELNSTFAIRQSLEKQVLEVLNTLEVSSNEK